MAIWIAIGIEARSLPKPCHPNGAKPASSPAPQWGKLRRRRGRGPADREGKDPVSDPDGDNDPDPDSDHEPGDASSG